MRERERYECELVQCGFLGVCISGVGRFSDFFDKLVGGV
jgi:hypothetical protein